MTAKSGTYWWAVCDHPSCATESRDQWDGGYLYDSPADVAAAMQMDRPLNDYGWELIDGKHYCEHHWSWSDTRPPTKVPVTETETP